MEARGKSDPWNLLAVYQGKLTIMAKLFALGLRCWNIGSWGNIDTLAARPRCAHTQDGESALRKSMNVWGTQIILGHNQIEKQMS